MSILIRKVGTWFIPIFTLASLFCAGYVAAQNDNQPNGAGQNARSNERPPANIKPSPVLKMWDENDPNRPKVYLKKVPGSPSHAPVQEVQQEEQKVIHLRPPQDAISASDNKEILSEREAAGTDVINMEDDVKFDPTPIPSTPPNIKKYLKDKYKANIVYEQLLGTTYGPNGRIRFSSEGIPVEYSGIDDRAERLRSKAKAFIASEPSLFGIMQVKELMEDKFTTDKLGYTQIGYKRYIGRMWLEFSYINVEFDKDENIRSVGANAIAISPEVYEAVNRVTLTKSNVRKIIEQELAYRLNATSIYVHNMEKVVIPKPPYVIYKVGVSADQAVESGIPRDLGSWDFRIDAFSGEILNRRSALE